MSGVILKIENVSKQYRLGTIGSASLRDDIRRTLARIRGVEDPFSKVGAVNDRSVKNTEDYVWALRDINFEVRQGEVLGIIGKNGAGKSTLLKILSRVTSPTTGEIKSRGRIASLLEVGTGFHHELTGRENIFLNGAILGMTKSEIASKFDEIVDFSGCERYIDTPTKRYSSGMTVRLAFAVAAHLEPEILVVDEVLAVGDAEFQKKAIGKMQDISQGEGRTVLFVSHNMASVQSLCSRGILIDNGKISKEGSVRSVIDAYLNTSNFHSLNSSVFELNSSERTGNKMISIRSVEFLSNGENKLPVTGESVEIKFRLSNPNNLSLNEVNLDFRVDDIYGQRLLWFSTKVNEKNSNEQKESISFHINRFPLNHGTYFLTTHLMHKNQVADWAKNAAQFKVIEGFFYPIYEAVSHDQSKVLIDYDVTYD